MAYHSKCKTSAFKIYTRDIRILSPPWEGLMSLHMKRRQWCGTKWSGQKGHVSWIKKEAFPHTTTINITIRWAWHEIEPNLKYNVVLTGVLGYIRLSLFPWTETVGEGLIIMIFPSWNPSHWEGIWWWWHGIQYLCHRSKLNNSDC